MTREQRTVDLLEIVAAAGVEFVVIGGVAAHAWGSTLWTEDLDLAMSFTHDQVSRLLDALGPYAPRHATRPDLGVIKDPIPYLMTFRMLLIETSIGRIDVLREVAPLGGHADLVGAAVEMEISGHTYRIIGIDDLITIKQHVARPKDLQAAVELRAIRSRLVR